MLHSWSDRTTVASGVDWGNVPTWVGAVLTSASLLIAFYIILRDRRKEDRENASELVCWLEWSEHGQYQIGVHNTSQKPMFRVEFVVIPRNRIVCWWHRKRYGKFHAQLCPKTYDAISGMTRDLKIYHDGIITAAGEQGSIVPSVRCHKKFYVNYVRYEDARGKRWLRNVNTRRLSSRWLYNRSVQWRLEQALTRRNKFDQKLYAPVSTIK